MSGPELRAVFFDVGGTLLRPWPSVGAVYARVGERHGFSAAAAAMETAFRAAWRSLPPTDSGLTTARKEWWRQLVGGVFDSLGLGGSERQRTACFEDLYVTFARPEAWRVFPDVADALHQVRARGWHVGVISNWDERLRPLLAALRLTDWDSITVSCEVGAEKPRAAIFEAALRAAGVAAGTALHVGDSAEADVRGAQAVGMQAVLIDREGSGRPGRGIVRDLRQLVALYQGLDPEADL